MQAQLPALAGTARRTPSARPVPESDSGGFPGEREGLMTRNDLAQPVGCRRLVKARRGSVVEP
jgi:hypothetical protein